MLYTWTQILNAHKHISDCKIDYRHFCNTWSAINARQMYNSSMSITLFDVLYEITKIKIIENKEISINDIQNKYLFLRDLHADNIFPIQDIVDIEVIDCMNNSIDSLVPIKSMLKLKEAYFYKNRISNIEPLINLKELKILDLSENEIYNIRKISLLENLKELDLSGNKVYDISSLAHLKNLTKLNITGNNITHILDIKALKNLTSLYLDTNTIIIEELVELCKELPGCKINISYTEETFSGYLKEYNNQVFCIHEIKGTGNSFHTYIRLIKATNNLPRENTQNDMKSISRNLALSNKFFYNPSSYIREHFPIETKVEIEGQYDY